MKTIPLTATGPRPSARRRPGTGHFAAAWAEQLEALRRQLRRCRRDASEPRVHALRIAARRLLALLELVPAAQARAFDRHRRLAKRLLRATGAARDAAVQAQLLAAIAASNPRLPARVLRRQVRDENRELAQRLMEELDRRRFRRNRRLAPAPTFITDRVARTRVQRTVVELRRRAQANPKRTEAVHRLRLALKRARYLAEACAPVLPPGLSRTITQLRAAQGRLGLVRDLERLQGWVQDAGLGSHDLAAWNHVLARRRRRAWTAWTRDRARLLAALSPSPARG